LAGSSETEKLVFEVVRRVVAIFGDLAELDEPVKIAGNGPCAYEQPAEAVTAALRAQLAWQWDFSLDERKHIINSTRAKLSCDETVDGLAALSIEETGMGRLDDKAVKIRLALEKTPGPEFFRTNALTGDHGLAIEELSPFGVITALTPSTDPSPTVINNALCMISGGNGVVFAPHQAAIRSTLQTAEKLSEALVELGAPEGLITAIAKPEPENLLRLMNHESVSLICATGGRSAIASALRSGKPAIAAGPGNPPVLVDETADLRRAADDIITGCSFDNNVTCISEKELFVVHQVADELRKHMLEGGRAFALSNPSDVKKLLGVVLSDGALNRTMIGRSPAYILSKIGIRVPDDVRLILVETGETHPFVQQELLMPILPMVRVADFEDGLCSAVRVEHSLRLSGAIHSTNINNMSKMARAMETAIFTKNAPSLSSIGYNGDCPTAFTIATTTGQGPVTPLSFCRTRRCVLSGSFRIV
jgi:propionaldehyde dehydrogenase